MSNRVLDQIRSILGAYDEEQGPLSQQTSPFELSDPDVLTTRADGVSRYSALEVTEIARDFEMQMFGLLSSIRFQLNEDVSSWKEEIIHVQNPPFTELATTAIELEPKGLLASAIRSIHDSDYQRLLDVAAGLHDSKNRQIALNALEKAFSFSIASTNDPLLSAKFEDLQLSVIKLRRASTDKVESDRTIEELVAELENKLTASRDVQHALKELGLNAEEVFGNFEMKTLPDGKVQYTWKGFGSKRETQPK